jgi:hypothetical protein
MGFRRTSQRWLFHGRIGRRGQRIFARPSRDANIHDLPCRLWLG